MDKMPFSLLCSVRISGYLDIESVGGIRYAAARHVEEFCAHRSGESGIVQCAGSGFPLVDSGELRLSEHLMLAVDVALDIIELNTH